MRTIIIRICVECQICVNRRRRSPWGLPAAIMAGRGIWPGEYGSASAPAQSAASRRGGGLRFLVYAGQPRRLSRCEVFGIRVRLRDDQGGGSGRGGRSRPNRSSARTRRGPAATLRSRSAVGRRGGPRIRRRAEAASRMVNVSVQCSNRSGSRVAADALALTRSPPRANKPGLSHGPT